MRHDESDRSGPNGRGDEPTGRTAALEMMKIGQARIFKKLESNEKRAKTTQFWVQLVAGVVGGVFLAGLWVAHTWAGVAHVEQLEAVRARVGNVESGMSIIGVKVDALGADDRWSRDQLLEIARTVRAPMVVQPLPPPTPILEKK